MWQRFNEKARRAVFFAQEEAIARGEDSILPEHLLLGLTQEGSSYGETMAARLLEGLSASSAQVRALLEQKLRPARSRALPVVDLSPRTRRVIDLAYSEARLLENNYIGTEHLLLGIIREGEGLSGESLGLQNVGIQRAREEARRLQREAHQKQELVRPTQHSAPPADQMLHATAAPPDSAPKELLRPESNTPTKTFAPRRLRGLWPFRRLR